MTLYPTQNDLPQKTREQIIDLLNARLADLSDLYSQIKQAHWNVKGPNFIALHELFDDAAETILPFVDEVAERAVQLGGIAYGTVRLAAKNTSISEYPTDISTSKDHIDAVVNALSSVGKLVRQDIDVADKLGDKDTADLFTEISRGIDKFTWFVEAHKQAKN